jgi:hypothetical protein
MTMPAPRPSSTAADLMRLLAVWLAAILLVQGLAAGLALGAGPLHRHGSAAVRAHDQLHQHDGAERHHHRTDDASVVAQAEPALDASALALVAALALMAFSILRFALAAQRPVWAAAMQRFWRSAVPAPPRKPPRAH